MAAPTIFQPVQASSTAGATVKVTTVSAANVRSSITITAPIEANAIMVTNGGTGAAAGDPGTGTLVFVRVSAEALPTATAADVPLLPGQTVTVQNPVPSGVVGIAVKASGTTVNDIYFTPIETRLND
jgi:hypothetical protein